MSKLLMLFLWSFAGAQTAFHKTCALTPVLSLPQNSSLSKRFKAWSQNLVLAGQPAIRDSITHTSEIYEVDIHNDGKRQLIVPLLEGSGGYLSLNRYVESIGGFQRLAEEIDAPAGFTSGNGPWYWHSCPAKASYHSIGQNLFLICDSDTFFSFAGDEEGTCPIYFWKGDSKPEYACRDSVFEFTLNFANEAASRKNDHVAVNILKNYQAHCPIGSEEHERICGLEVQGQNFVKGKIMCKKCAQVRGRNIRKI